MALIEVTTHVSEAQGYLIKQFKDLDNWESILEAWVDEVQEIEVMLFQLLDDLWLDTAVGDNLDVLGIIVGEERQGKSDANYRLWLRARILANRSSGTPENILELINLIIDNDFQLTEWYPAVLSIVISDALTATASELADIISDTRVAGVRGMMEYTLVDDSLTFTFAEADVVQADAIRGWSAAAGQDEWTEAANPKDFTLRDVVYGDDGLFLAVGAADGTDAYMVTSADGITWTERANPKNFILYDAVYNDGLWAAVGAADGVDAYMVSSLDGLSWAEVSNPKNFDLYGITLSCAEFVAVGEADGVDSYIVTSSDGAVWTERANPKNFDLYSVACGGGTSLVAVGEADGVDAYIVTSPDSINWTERGNPKNFTLRAVAYGDGQWVAVGDADGVDAYIVTSSDGITWTERSNPKNFGLRGVAYSDGLWVAIGDADGTDAYMVTSYDGVTWTERTNAKNFRLFGVANNGSITDTDIWTAVGEADGVDAYIVTSSMTGGRLADVEDA